MSILDQTIEEADPGSKFTDWVAISECDLLNGKKLGPRAMEPGFRAIRLTYRERS